MGPAFFIMAILGCGDGQATCQQVRVTDAHYVSADACNAAVPSVLMDASDLSFPEVVAECRPGKGALAVVPALAPRG